MVLVKELDGIEEQSSRRGKSLVSVLHEPLTSDSWHSGFSSRIDTP
jgi:hypothetical protein